MFRLLLIVGILFGGTEVLSAPNPTTNDLKQVEAQLLRERLTQKESERKAAVLNKEVQSVQGQLVSAAKKIQSHEDRLSLLEQKKIELEERQAHLEQRLNLSNKQLTRIMKGMQTLALRPTELLIFQKKTPVDMFRSRNLMRYSLPVIGQMRDQTKADLAELSSVRQEISQKMQDIQKTYMDLKDESEQMNRLLQQKQLMQIQYTAYYNDSKKKAEALAAKARDLKDLLQKLEKQRREAKKKRPPKASAKPVLAGAFAKTYSHLSWPVSGTITQHFGDQTASGVHAKGLTLKTRPKATITTPYDGTVLFAGPFQNYGQLMIIDHGDEYLTVLSGFGSMDVSVGQEVLAGEPIGAMSQNNTNLYLEMRYRGQAIDPEPWFKKGGR